MALGQALLDRMELLNQELQLQSGEPNVAQGLLALNVAQDYLESVLALTPRAFGDTSGTVVTAASTETTTFPTGVIRLDRLQYIDPETSRPVGPDLENLGYVGAHVNYEPGIPPILSADIASGRPHAYWTQGRNIYWAPLPDAIHTFRWYGLSAVADISAAGTFAYPDYLMMPLATLAVKVLTIGVDDPPEMIQAFAEELFTPAIQAMRNFNQDRSPGYDYRYLHSE